MKKFLITFLIFTLSHATYAKFYGIEAGYGQFTNSALSSAKTSLTGSKTKISMGIDNNKVPSTLFIQYADKKGLVNHDNEVSEIKLKSISYGIKSNFILTQKSYLILGYQFVDLEFNINHSSEYSKNGIKKHYNTIDGESNGVFYGLGYNFYQTKSSNLFLEFLHQNISTYNSVFNHLSLGVRFKL